MRDFIDICIAEDIKPRAEPETAFAKAQRAFEEASKGLRVMPSKHNAALAVSKKAVYYVSYKDRAKLEAALIAEGLARNTGQTAIHFYDRDILINVATATDVVFNGSNLVQVGIRVR